MARAFSNWKTWIVAAAGLLVLAGTWVTVRHWPFTERRIAQQFQETFPVTVKFTKFRRIFFPHPGCIGEGVEFRRLGGSAEVPPIVVVRQLKIEAHYLDVLFRPGVLAKIITDGFEVRVPARGTPVQDTRWKPVPSKLRVGEIILDGAVLEVERSDDHGALRFDIHRLKLTSVSQSQPFNYDVFLHNALPPGEIRARGSFGPWKSDHPGDTALSGAYTFRGADLGIFSGISGTLSSDDRFQGTLQHIEATGSVDIPNFATKRNHHEVHLTSRFHAFIDGTNGDVQLEQVNASFLRTEVTAAGRIVHETGTHGKTASIDFYVTDGRIEDAMWLVVRERKPALRGVSSFRAHVVLPPGRGEFLEKVRVTSDFGVAGGVFTKPGTRDSVQNLSERARGEKPAEQNKNEESNDDGVVSDLSGHLELRNAVATLTDFSFQVPGASAQMHGTYHLTKRTVDLHGTLKSQAELSEMNSGFKSVLLKPFDKLFKKKHAGAVLPVHLIGTYDDPQPGIDIIPKGSDGKQQTTKQ